MLNYIGTLNEDLSNDQNEIISELIVNPNLTQGELSDKIGLGKRSIARLMKELQEMKIIERVGSKKSGYWKVVK